MRPGCDAFFDQLDAGASNMTKTSRFRRALAPRLRLPFLAASVLSLGGALALWPNRSFAHEHQAGMLKIEHPWSRATAAGTTVGAAYMVIKNTGKADALLSGSSPVAERVELHYGRIEGGVMKMRRMQRIELPAGETVRLEPGGLHIMLIGLKQSLVEGSKVPLVLRFAGAGEHKVELIVEAMGAQGKAAQPSGAPARGMDHSHH